MNIEEKIQQSVARQDRVVFKNSLNEHNTLFGGLALKWMDEVAYLSAHRFARKDILTLTAGPIKFRKPIPYKSFIIIEGKVSNVGRVKLTISVKVYIEDKETGARAEAIEGDFVFVAVDENLKPVRLM
ncbi:MAG: acyl-CoA thioesterase [Bacteroidales bacterium]|nr:acyl-CoA thioesterase [Bacteroidales bacterium]MCF8457263.1 acyl-CoA thioesterase [Bacteroidales bacterium]